MIQEFDEQRRFEQDSVQAPTATPTFTIIRVSREDQLRGYGPDAQWEDDVLPNAGTLGLQVDEHFRRIIQEPATDWNRPKFEEIVNEAINLHHAGQCQALLFPRVDRETRFLFASFPILCDAIRSGLQVYFARERFRLDPEDGESVSRYLRKAEESRAYVETMRINTMQGRRRRVERDGMMPTGRSKWAYEYHPYRRDWGRPTDATSGRHTVISERVPIVQAWAKWILDEGASLSECQRRTLREFGIDVSRSAVSDTLKDPIIVGKVYAYRSRKVSSPQGSRDIRLPESEWKLVYENNQLAIITEEQFSALRVKFQRNKEHSSRNIKNWYPPIRGMVFCSSCEKKMSGQFRGGRQPGFRCPPCRRWVKAVPLWNEIQIKVREIILQPDLLAAALRSQLDSGETVGRIAGEIKEIQRKLTTLVRAEQKALRLHLYVDDAERDSLSEELLLAARARIQNQRKELTQREEELHQQLARVHEAKVSEEGVRRFLVTASRNLESWDESRWGVLLEALRLKIVAHDDRVDVEIAVPSLEGEERVTMYPTSPCGPRLTPTDTDTIGNRRAPEARATAWIAADPCPVRSPTIR